jgi:hypothetical protein
MTYELHLWTQPWNKARRNEPTDRRRRGGGGGGGGGGGQRRADRLEDFVERVLLRGRHRLGISNVLDSHASCNFPTDIAITS